MCYSGLQASLPEQVYHYHRINASADSQQDFVVAFEQLISFDVAQELLYHDQRYNTEPVKMATEMENSPGQVVFILRWHS